MGASWSSDHPTENSANTEQTDPPSHPKYLALYGDVVPEVCSDRPEDCYDDLYEDMYYVQHASQDCLVAFQSCQKDNPRIEPEDWFALAERIPRVYEYLAHSINMRNVDLDQPIDLHPRIVK